MTTELKTRTWADGPLAAFDLETTGTNPEAARIVTASVVELNGSDAPVETSALCDPGVDIPEEAAAVHGITTEEARAEGTPAAEVVGWLSAALGDLVEAGVPLIIYNATYDLTVLDRECRRYDVPTLSDRCAETGSELAVVDPLVLDRHVDRYRKGSRRLAVVAEHYGVTLTDADAHTSTGDCFAAARVAWHIAHQYRKVGELPIPALMALQGAAHAEWAESFEAYRRKAGSDETISRDWPLRPFGVIL